MAVALTLLSGWPFADLALLISILVAAEVSTGRRRAVAVASGRVAGCGARGRGSASPRPPSCRSRLYATHTDARNRPGLWAADVPALLGVGVPYFITHWRFDRVGMKTV